MSEISLSKMGADSTKLKKLFFYSKCLCIVGFSLTLTAIGSYFFADYMLKDQLYKVLNLIGQPEVTHQFTNFNSFKTKCKNFLSFKNSYFLIKKELKLID